MMLAAVLLILRPNTAAAQSVSARSAVLIDAHNHRVLWSKNSDQRALIASTTKIMTGLLIAESCSLQDMVRVQPEAVGIEGSSMYLQEGELLTVEALLYGLMLHSGNDAAVALALYHSGDVETFVAAMNAKAGELGLSDTCFANPHGLDDENNYATACDLAVLAACAMENPVFSSIVSTKSVQIESRSFTNHNKLLWRCEGVIGVKTGYTKSAGRILVSCAERDDRRLVAVTIHAPDDWNDHQRLYEYGFSQYESRSLLQTGQIVAQVPVMSGAEAYAQAVVSGDYGCLLTKEETVEFFTELPAFVYAPVLAGDQAGMLHMMLDGIEIGSVPLYWRYSVLESG